MRFVSTAPLLVILVACSTQAHETDGGMGSDSAVDAGPDGHADALTPDVGPDADAGTDAAAPDGGDAGVEDGWGVLSLNLHCLKTDRTSFADNAARFDAIAAEVAARGVRVLLLQEVCDDGTENAFDLLSSALADRTGTPWQGGEAFAHLAWVGTPDEAEESVAILADVPVSDLKTHEHHAQGALRRVVLSAELGGDLGGLRVATFHLDHDDDAARLVQARELATAALLHAGSANVLLGGDLNDREGTPPHEALGALGYVDATDPLTPTRIDHIFVQRGASVRAIGAQLLFRATPVSDHPGVLVRIEATTPAPVDFTTIDVDADVGFGNALFVRGDQAPLSWDEGLPAINAGSTSWRFATTELTGTFEYKALSNDTLWSTGANFAGTAGAANSETVSAFE